MTTLDELRDRILARRDLAEKATASPWIVWVDDDGYAWVWRDQNGPHYNGIAQCCIDDEGASENERADARHIAANDPATVIRNCVEDLAMLDLAARVAVWEPYRTTGSLLRESIARRYGVELA